MTELKPCPFCGRKAELKWSTTTSVIPYAKHEQWCPIKTASAYTTEEQAIKAWNKRSGENK